MKELGGAVNDLIAEMGDEEDMTNKWVWIPHAERVWTQAQVISMLFDEDNPDTTTEYLIDHPDSPGVFKKILLKDCHKVDPSHTIDLDNICLMNDMHEAPLLDLLRRRFFNKNIYTYAGDVLISINPYEYLESIYEDPLQFFSLAANDSLEEAVVGERQNIHPHVFQIANRALCSLTKEHLKTTTNNEIADGKLEAVFNNQSIIISGESGAGKTENSKHVLSFLIAANNMLCGNLTAGDEYKDDFAGHLKSVLTQSSLLLEAFGNAKTLRNDNSSRFGKYIKLLYKPHRKGSSGKVVPKLLSAQTETFLLEKSRLSSVGSNERSYHIFYQLLSGLDDEELRTKLHLERDLGRYKLLQACDGLTTSFTSADSKEYEDTIDALKALECSDEEIYQIVSLIAAVLHLGNFILNGGEDIGEGGGSEIVKLECSTIPLDELANILGLEMSTFKMSLTMQQLVIARRASLKMKILSPAEVENNLSALLKMIYSNLFDWIVRKINYGHCRHNETMNTSLEMESYNGVQNNLNDSISFIGILDIFGFEILAINSFEQLCINFANERLQQQFNQHVFVKEQELYLAEGLDWSNISYRDNQNVIDTIAGTKKPNLGLLLLIEELGMLNRKPDDIALISSFNQIHDTIGITASKLKQISVYSKSKLGKEYFTVKHFAGDVTYYIEGFLAKNNDTIQQDLVKLLTSSKNEFLRNVMKFPGCKEGQIGFIPPTLISTITSSAVLCDSTETLSTNQSSAASKKLAASNSVSSQFRNQLDTLMNLLTSTSPNYIKCIKPNAMKKAETFDPDLVDEQLRYSGVMEVVRIRREGFPLRMTFFDFYRDYEILAKGKSKTEFPDPLTCTFEEARKCCIALTASCLEPSQYKIGHSLVFLRDNGKQMMVDAIKMFFHRKVAKVQALFKMRGQRQWYLSFLDNLSFTQAIVRGFLYKRHYQRMKCASNCIKQYLKFSCQRLKFLRIYEEILYEKQIQAVMFLQRVIRGHFGRLEYYRRHAMWMERRHKAATAIQSLIRGHLRRVWFKDAKLHLAATTIQCLARRKFAYNIAAERSYAIFVIQSFCRMCVARFYAAKAMRSVILLQAVGRKYIARKRFLQCRHAVIKIQTSFRMFLAFRYVFLHYAAIWCIQSVVRMWLVRRRFVYAKQSAITIQKYVRRQQAANSFMSNYIAIINCQRFARGFIARVKYRISYVSVLMMQTFLRMAIFRRRYLHFIRALTKLQARYRSKVASMHYLVTVEKIIAAQAMVRRYLGMSRKRREMKSILVLQSFARMINEKRKFDETSVAAITIQTCMRRKVYRNRFLFLRKQASIMQSLFRRAHARLFRKRAMQAIVKLQSFGRMLNKKREYDEIYVHIVMVQSILRRKLAMKSYQTIRTKVIKLQSWMKMHLAMNSYYMHIAAAIAIQSFARRVVAVCRLRNAQLACICIQTYARRFLVERQYQATKIACGRIQPVIRMFLCRSRYKKVLYAQTTIAKFFRGHSKYKQFKCTVMALIRIQRFAKRFLNRLHFKKRIDGLFNVAMLLLAVNKQPRGNSNFVKSSQQNLDDSNNTEVAAFAQHLKLHPEDRLIRFAANDFCTLGQSLVIAKQNAFMEQLHLAVSEAFDVDKFARNAAHYIGMYPSIECFRVYLQAINSFKYHHTGDTVMAALDDDDEDNDNDENEGNENIKQLKQALNMSVGNSTLKQGWLKKKRGGWNWQKRWFVLTEDYIIYYKNPQSINNPKFAIPLEGCTVQRAVGTTKDPVIELTSPNMGEKKKLFGGSKNNKMISFLAENEKELQEWLMPLKAVAGVDTLRTSPPVNYVHTELCQLWVAAVDKSLETPLHLLVRYHCLRQAKKVHQAATSQSSGTNGATKPPARRVSVIQRIKQSIVAQKNADLDENNLGRQNSDSEKKITDNSVKKYSPDDPYKLMDRDVEFSLEETVEILTWLVELGCPINGQNYVGDTALHIALQMRADPKIVRALLLKGADPKTFRNDHGVAPFDLIGSNTEMRALYMDVFSNSTKNIGALFRTAPERTYVASTKLKGYSYLSIFLSFQFFENLKAVVNEKSAIIISAYNSSKQLIEATKEMKSPVWIDDVKTSGESVSNNKNKGEGLKILWGCSWHMQTPLDNLEPGSFIVIEYKSPPIIAQSSASSSTVSGIIELNMNTIDSGLQSLLLDDNGKQGNTVFANNDRSTLNLELIINQRNRTVDYRTIYGM